METESVPQFLASYDLKSTYPDPHGQFILQAKARGWSTYVTLKDGTRNKLPNTTLIGHFEDIEQATANFESIPARTAMVTRGPVILEKYIVAFAPTTRSGSDEH